MSQCRRTGSRRVGPPVADRVGNKLLNISVPSDWTIIPRWSTVPIAAGPPAFGPAASLGTEEQLPSPTLASWAKSRRSGFLREQDREDAPRHGRISRIGGAPFGL